jgi:hypothetical protein
MTSVKSRIQDSHNTALMKLVGSLGNVPQQFKKIVIKSRYILDC